MKEFFRIGTVVVTGVSLGLLVWAMFIPESNVFWNTYLGALVAGFIYFLVKFWRDRWDKNEYGSVLGKIAVVGMCTSIFGPTAQMLGLNFAGTNIMADANGSSLPCLFGISWALLLLAINLITIYIDTKDNNESAENWLLVCGSGCFLSLQVPFANGWMKVFGYTLPAWVEGAFFVLCLGLILRAVAVVIFSLLFDR